MTPNAIGGYFEISLAARGTPRYAQAAAFQSARAAFLSLLQIGRPPCVWLPSLICDSMIAPAVSLGVEVKFYDMTLDLLISGQVEPRPDDWLLCINYFGICGHIGIDALSRFDPGRVILDHSQAYYAAPPTCLATIYSPRKFFGLPDGGLLVTQLPIGIPHETDRSIARMRHLLIRLDEGPEAGYSDYLYAEETLADLRPRGMSMLTRSLLASYNAEGARVQRNENFSRLHELLGATNRIPIEFGPIDGPLCYPYWTGSHSLRLELTRRRIFVPSYWPEVLQRVASDSVEERWVSSVLALPCDQRYGDDEMTQVARTVRDFEETR